MKLGYVALVIVCTVYVGNLSLLEYVVTQWNFKKYQVVSDQEKVENYWSSTKETLQ